MSTHAIPATAFQCTAAYGDTGMAPEGVLVDDGLLVDDAFCAKDDGMLNRPSARAGRAVPLKMFHQGQSFGEESMLGRQRYEFTARARHSGTVLYLIQADAMTKLLSLFPGVRRELRDRAAQKLRELHSLVKAQ